MKHIEEEGPSLEDISKKQEQRLQEMEQKTKKMLAIAEEVGSQYDLGPNKKTLWFKSGDDAYAFQTICREEYGLEVAVVEPPRKKTAVFDDYYKITPV